MNLDVSHLSACKHFLPVLILAFHYLNKKKTWKLKKTHTQWTRSPTMHFMFTCVCISVSICHMCAGSLEQSKRHQIPWRPGLGITGSCELPNIAFGEQSSDALENQQALSTVESSPSLALPKIPPDFSWK